MAEASRSIGQAVVTDPLQGRASGYTLVAASPSVTSVEAQHLADTPQVTDHLHTSESPGPYVGWHRLPSGRWALVRRFTSGRRRGNYHRVVVHALMVPEVVLHTAGDDPWLLVARCQYRPRAGGTPQSLTALGATIEQALAESTAARLPDLECDVPADPRRERLEALGRRRAYLVERLGEDAVTRDLARVMAALAHGDRVLLDEQPHSVQLLALATSALPVSDRLAIGWTTHLATDAAHWFDIANVPDPRAARARLGTEDRWLVDGYRIDARDSDHQVDRNNQVDRNGPGSSPDPEPRDASSDAALALARAVVIGQPALSSLWHALRQEGLGLLGGGSEDVVRVAAWLEQGGEDAYRGFDRLESLADWLRAQAIDSPPSRCTAEGALAAASGTVLKRKQKGLDHALDEVVRVVDHAGKARPLLQASVVARLAEEDPGGLGDEGVAVAVALVLDRPGPARALDAARDDRAALARQLAAVEPRSPDVVDLRLARLADLWRDAPGDEAAASIAFEALRRVPDGLKRLAQGFGAPSVDAMPRVLRVYEAAASDCPAVAEDLARRVLLPALDDSVSASRVTDDQRERVLERLSSDLLIEQLATGRDRLYPYMVASLRRRAETRQPNLATVVATVVERVDGRLRADRGYVGLTRMLYGAGVAPDVWLPVAAAEAHALDGVGGGAGDVDTRQAFRRLLESEVDVPRTASARWAGLVLGQLGRAQTNGRLRTAHLALLSATSAGLAAEAEVLAVLEDLLKLDTVAVVSRVAPASTAVANDLENRDPERARHLRMVMWRELANARHRWRAFPLALVASFERLSDDDRRILARTFAPKLGWMGDDPGNRALRAALERAGAGDKAFVARKSVIAEAACGGILMPIVLDLRSRRAAPPELLRTLKEALRGTYPEKMRAIMPLMWSKLTQVERNVVEGVLLKEAIARAQGGKWIGALNESVPEAEQLRKSAEVAVTLAERVGARWRDDPQGAHGFLKLLVAAGVYEAVAMLIAESATKSDGLLAHLATSDHAPRNLFETLKRALVHPEYGHDLYVVRDLIRAAHQTLQSRR